MSAIARPSIGVGLVLALLLALSVGAAPTARASGYDLNGRTAPDMVFPTGMNGITPGMSLSSMRGRVVWIKFVLRDCPRCKIELPRAQQLHDRWGRSGLVVLVVVHQLGPSQMRDFMRRNGYSFRLGTDPRGDFANRYGVRHRPTDYVVGIDGRVVSSNAAPDSVLLTELGRYRLARLGAVPAELETVRRAVWNWDYGEALRQAEGAPAGAEASAELRALTQRLQALSREELNARIALAADLERRRQVAQARAVYDRVASHFQGTSLQAEAAEARRAFLARTGMR